MKRPSNLFAGLAFVGAGVSGVAAGCGSQGGGNDKGGNDAGLTIFDGSVGTFGGDDSGSDGSQIPQGQLAITPLRPTVTVTMGQPQPTVQFTATVGGQTSGVAWAVDRGELGAIDSSGVFRPSGALGGVATVSAVYGAQKVSTTITVNIVQAQQGDPAWSPPQLDGGLSFDAGAGGYGGVGGDGPGAVPAVGQMTALAQAPTADPAVAMVYPYDKTVWPQGLLAPLLQWTPGTHSFDSVYVHITEKYYEYKGYFAANKTPFTNLPIPEAAWDAATLSNGGEPLVVSLTFGEGTKAVGPVTESWTIAQATLQGTIYYNSYGTNFVKNSNYNDKYGRQFGAGTLAIASGATAPTLVAGVDSPSGDGSGCRVCHTVAADGQSLVTQASNNDAHDYSNTVGMSLTHDTTMGAGTSLFSNLAFPALYKDGSLLFSSSGGMINGDSPTSSLYSVPNKTKLAATGLPGDLRCALPAFSPDGKHVAFNFWAGTLNTSGGTAHGDERSLGLMDFDGALAFSNPRVPFKPSGSGTAVTYSSFLPNSAGVVFEIELSNPSKSWAYTWHKNTGELWWLDMASGVAHRLDSLNGYAADGMTPYVPNNLGVHRAAEDVTLNYEPTVNPVASGGYAWVVFTSRRAYGNVANDDPWESDPSQYDWLDKITDKKLWVSAVDLNAPAGTDPSHPAFYLPAQEIHAGNSRGYWSVEACRQDGMSCKTGTQCCGGYCQPAGDGGALVCSSQMPSCSAMYDRCTQTSDCCGAAQGITCINDICTTAQPPAK